MVAVVVDSSAIIALFDEDCKEHAAVAAAIERNTDTLVLSPFVVAEADYMLDAKLGSGAAWRFNEDVTLGAYELASWSAADHAEALQVVRAYSSNVPFSGNNYVGVTDASNVVLADRYRTSRIMTVDERHFRKLQPIWGPDYFTLIPTDASD